MKTKSRKDNWITARTTSDDRLMAEDLMQHFGLKTHSALVRTLIQREAANIHAS